MWRLWMSQSCFSLGFLSQYSLWKLSTFRGYTKSQFFQNRAGWWLGLATWLRLEFKPRTNWMASMEFLSCSALAGMTLQLLRILGTCATSGGLQVASYPRDPVAIPCYFAQTWAFLHTLPLHDSHLNTRLLIAKIQENLTRNKANKMVD